MIFYTRQRMSSHHDRVVGLLKVTLQGQDSKAKTRLALNESVPSGRYTMYLPELTRMRPIVTSRGVAITITWSGPFFRSNSHQPCDSLTMN